MGTLLVVLSMLLGAASPTSAAQVHDAVKAGDLAALQALVGRAPELAEAADENGRTPLFWACREGKPEIAAFLLTGGARVDAADNTGTTPLHTASGRGHVPIVGLLLGAGANPNALDATGRTPLTLAATYGQLAAVALLVEKGANLESRDRRGRTPLVSAAREMAGVGAVGALLDAGADIDARDDGDDSALMLAAWRGSADVVDLLLDRGAKVDSAGPGSRQLLGHAVSKGLERLFDTLAQHGADLTAESEGRTLLHAAAAGGSVHILEVLLDKAPGAGGADANGWTALHFAADMGRSAAAALLFRRGADVDARTLMGQTAYNLAAENLDREIADLLIARGADVGPPRFPRLSGPYLGQAGPGTTPVPFAPGIVSARYNLHSSVAFSPDGKEAMWSVSIPPRGAAYGSGRTLVSRLEGGRWTYPRPAVYEGQALDDVPIYGPRGTTLYDMADRPLPGTPAAGTEHIWVWERTGTRWAKPKPVDGAVNDLPLHWQFGVDGRESIYVAASLAGGRGGDDIYVSRKRKGRYRKPEDVGGGVNTAAGEMTPFVTRDGTTLLFSRDGDLYASTRGRDGTWNEARKIGGGVSTDAFELCPVLTPDGRYLVFLRGWRPYWVDAHVLTEASP